MAETLLHFCFYFVASFLVIKLALKRLSAAANEAVSLYGV